MIKILVTAFGAFPGARANRTLSLLDALAKRSRRFERLGITLDLRALSVVYRGLDSKLMQLVDETKPDAIFQFGLAGRRKAITVESLARNRANPLHPDAARRLAPHPSVVRHGPSAMRARVPVTEIVAALQRAGIASKASRNAGDYICNVSFYHALALVHAPFVGFIHIPNPRQAKHGDRKDKRPRFEDITRAAEIALIVIARAIRRTGEPSALRSHAPLRYAG